MRVKAARRLEPVVCRTSAFLLAIAFVFLAPPATAADVTLVIEARNIRWNPASITVNQGDVVTLVIFNNDTSVAHTFELTGYNEHIDLPAGGNGTITFAADRAGSFQYWCAVPGHAPFDSNTNRYTLMAGDFIVRAPAPPPTPGFEALGVVAAVAIVFAALRMWIRGRDE